MTSAARLLITAGLVLVALGVLAGILAIVRQRLHWRQLGDATSRGGIPCRQSKPALKRPAGATQRKVASHLPLGHLPGDVVWRGRHTTVYFPWVTMLVLSAILTLILNLFRR